MNFHRNIFIGFAIFTSLFVSKGSLYALTPEEVLVVANMNASGSKGLAAYYMEKRRIPKENLVLVFMTDQESCTRDEYEKKVLPPVRRAVDANPDIRAIVTIYGVPLKISPPEYTLAEQTKYDALMQQKETLEAVIAKNEFQNAEQKKLKEKQLSRINNQIRVFKAKKDKAASFDSELMLVKLSDYELNYWLPNPYFLGFKKGTTRLEKTGILMTSRLDAAAPDIVRRIIDDSIEAEKNGLKGSAYFDARWKDPGDKKVKGYGLYDRSIHRAARIISNETAMKVFINDEERLFAKGESPDTALYCGWYSLAKYVDAFTWQKGSVGFHIASSECATLKSKNSQVWCKKMLDNGAAATIGPVGEPYVQAFPMPEIFFKFLAEGYLSLAESYLLSLPYLSWKMVLVGDPLYRLNVVKSKEKDTTDGT